MTPITSAWRRRVRAARRGREPLHCRELVELVTDYLEGALEERQRRRFEDHLTRCPACATYVEQLRVTLRELGRLRESDLAPGPREELLVAFRDWRRASALR